MLYCILHTDLVGKYLPQAHAVDKQFKEFYMEKIYKSADMLIGRTPLLELVHIEKNLGLKARIVAKLEYFNPAGSVKDRAAKYMIEDAEKKGILKKGSVIVEPTSGNTGIGLASVGTAKGYRVILTMPDTMSEERRKLIKAYGAEIILSDGSKGMRGAVDKAEETASSLANAVILGQFDNPANPLAHYETTGPEIFEDTDGQTDYLVAGVGTGGTISGTGKYLKERIPGIKIVAVEPESSPLLGKGYAGPHKIQGIGANFVPSALDLGVYDEITQVSDEDAFKYGRMIGKEEGVLAGISSGAALCAAVRIAALPENAGKTIVVIFPDGGDRYFSTPMFSD